MILKSKTLRYYYWITREFGKKHFRLILFSFFLSFLILISLISFTPYLAQVITPKRDIVGIVGDYRLQNLPDEISSKLSHGLVFLNEKGEIAPALATSWEVKDQGKEFRFKIKKNLFWDDGKPFKASDINYQFKDVQTKIINDTTISFTLDKRLTIFPTYLTRPVIRHPLHGIVGQYKVDRLKSKFGVVKEISMSPNKSDLNSIIYKFYENEGKLINAYKKGEITQMTLTNKSRADQFINWKNSKITKTVDYSRILTLFINLRSKYFEDKEVRKAVESGIPKDQFADSGELASGPIAPISWAYNPLLKKNIFDPDSARKNFKRNEASAEAELDFKTYFDYLDTATEINNFLKETGLNTSLRLTSIENETQFDLLLTFLKLPADPDQYYFWHSTQSRGNITGYKNVKIDKLLEDARNTVKIDERKKNYDEFQKVIIDDVPAIFIYYPYIYTIKRK